MLPSPKFHKYPVILPIEAFIKFTSRGVNPKDGVAIKSAEISSLIVVVTGVVEVVAAGTIVVVVASDILVVVDDSVDVVVEIVDVIHALSSSCATTLIMAIPGVRAVVHSSPKGISNQ